MEFWGTLRSNTDGVLEIGGVDVVSLKEEFNTPLIAYDVEYMRNRAKEFHEAFLEKNVPYQVCYASKAFSCIAMVQLAKEESLCLDVVSGGELYTALQAGFPADKIHFHGNNKSKQELIYALEAGVGCIVVDNFYELSLLQELTILLQKEVSILFRVTPGIEAHTHEYIQTGQEDSKFGFDLASGQAEEALLKCLQTKQIHPLGFHFHIGSQIFETTGFTLAIERMFTFLVQVREKYQYAPSVFNVGGGFGIKYLETDEPISIKTHIHTIVDSIQNLCEIHQFTLPEIWVEPGRSIVGDAGFTLYETGSQKHIPGIRSYLSVDGGMSDNIRPALYQAEYEVIHATKLNDKKGNLYSVAGKCCESGDMVVWDASLPKFAPGDLLAVMCTGAYGYSMANNYNRLPRPAVVFVENGNAYKVVERETYADIVRLDLPLQTNGLKKETNIYEKR